MNLLFYEQGDHIPAEMGYPVFLSFPYVMNFSPVFDIKKLVS